MDGSAAVAERLKDRFLDPWRAAAGAPAVALVAAVREVVEAIAEARQRARSETVQRLWEGLLEALVCDLAHAVLVPPPSGKIVFPLRHGDDYGPPRYRNAAFGKPRRALALQLQSAGLLTMHTPLEVGLATVIAPTRAFRDLMRRLGVTRSDIGRNPAEEVLILKRSLKTASGRSKTKIDYDETPETLAMREAVRSINDHLAAAEITFEDDGCGMVDTEDRTLRRFFTVLEDEAPRFDQGGRVFGGFWQPLKSARRKHMRIEGEPVAVLDFSAAFSHIAFAEQGIVPEGNPYAVPGLTDLLARSQIKSAFNVFYFVGARIRRWPLDLMEQVDLDTGEVLEGIPKGATPTRVRRAILAAHPSLEAVLGTDAGYRFMWKESEIMLTLLGRLRAEGIVGLPIHDALAVPRSAAPRTRELMAEVSTSIAGAAIPVREEQL